MSSDALAIFDFGHKLDAEYKSKLVGQTAMFADLDRDKDPEQTLSGMMTEARLVRNSGSAALAPGSVVKYTTVGTDVEAAGSGDVPAGVVDPWLTSDAEQDETFWIVIEGPAKVISGGAFSDGDPLIAGAAGKAVTNTINHTKLGKAMADASGADELVRAYISIPGVF